MNNKTIKIASRYSQAIKREYPFSIQCAILDKCFNNCPMCDHPQRPQFQIEKERWFKFLNQALGLESVCYSGGDAMAYHPINELMEFHISKGILFGFITSGYVPKSVDLRLLSHASWVRVSLDTVNPHLYDQIRGLISINKVIDSIDRMRLADVNVELAPTVHNDNHHLIHQVIDYAIENRLPTHIKSVHKYTYGFDEINWDSIKEKAKTLGEKGIQYNVYDPNKHLKFKKCSACLYQLFIDSKGDVYPCSIMAGDTDKTSNMPPLGNIDDWESLIIERGKFSKTEELLEKCSFCTARLSLINNTCDSIDSGKTFF